MIHTNDTIKELIDKNHFRTKYRASCDACGKDRGYLNKQNAQKPHCTSCCIRHTAESKLKMSLAKKGKIPWNKGKSENRSNVINKLSVAKLGSTPTNKGKRITFEQKVKISCSVRGINLKDFDELKTPQAKIERNKFAELGLHLKRFELDNYICKACGVDKITLNAHHVNSWKHFPEQRFNLDNLISLCVPCHKKFHLLFGNGKTKPNTADQLKQFLDFHKKGFSKTVYVVAGVSGAGKSWVCGQLPKHTTYVPYDTTRKDIVRSVLWNADTHVTIYDPTTHVSSFIKRNSDLFDIKLIVIIEDETVIKTRLKNRGGQFSESIKRRAIRMKNLAKNAVFTGTSSEVLDYLLKSIK